MDSNISTCFYRLVNENMNVHEITAEHIARCRLRMSCVRVVLSNLSAQLTIHNRLE